jgi:hypothetical protein
LRDDLRDSIGEPFVEDVDIDGNDFASQQADTSIRPLALIPSGICVVLPPVRYGALLTDM